MVVTGVDVVSVRGGSVITLQVSDMVDATRFDVMVVLAWSKVVAVV